MKLESVRELSPVGASFPPDEDYKDWFDRSHMQEGIRPVCAYFASAPLYMF
jgi:hypothetical protein